MNLATINYIICVRVCVWKIMFFICIYNLRNSGVIGCYVKF